MINAIFEYGFLQNALLGGILASIACGIIGTIIIEKKLVMMSGGIAHTAFGGIGMGYFLGIEPMIGALFFAIASAMGINTIRRKTDTNSDILIGMFWSIGMAMGIVFIAFTPGYPPDITSYLFGDILTITKMDIRMMLLLDGIIVLTVIMLFKILKSYMFDEEFTSILGINTVFIEYMLFILIALTVVILIRVVGLILIITLLTIPPAIVKLFSYDLKKIMGFGIVISIGLCIFGLWISYILGISSGASIIILSGIAYIISAFIRKLVL